MSSKGLTVLMGLCMSDVRQRISPQSLRKVWGGGGQKSFVSCVISFYSCRVGLYPQICPDINGLDVPCDRLYDLGKEPFRISSCSLLFLWSKLYAMFLR